MDLGGISERNSILGTSNQNIMNTSAVIINAGVGGGIASGLPRIQQNQRESYTIQGANNNQNTNGRVTSQDRNLFPINVYTPDKYVKKAYL